MAKSVKREGVFGKYTEHYDDDGKKIGESRECEGFFGKYVEHTDAEGKKVGESHDRKGFLGNYVEYTDSSGRKIGESRERESFFGNYTEHTDSEGRKIGKSREREGFFQDYTEHTGEFHPYHKQKKDADPETTSSNSSGVSGYSGYRSSSYSSYDANFSYSSSNSSTVPDSPSTGTSASHRRLLFLSGAGLVALAVLWSILPAIQPSEEEKAFKRFMNYERLQAENHPYQKYKEEIKKIYAIDPKVESTLVKRMSENQALVTISGNNEYFKNPDYPLGHDTTAMITPKDEVIIRYAGGRLSYNQYGHGNKIPVWGGYNFSLMRPGESIRYKQELSSLAVFAVLRSDRQEQAERFKIGHLEIRMQNNFSQPARLYLFYNTKEKFRGNDHSIQDGFPHAGVDGSRRSFIVEIIKNNRFP